MHWDCINTPILTLFIRLAPDPAWQLKDAISLLKNLHLQHRHWSQRWLEDVPEVFFFFFLFLSEWLWLALTHWWSGHSATNIFDIPRQIGGPLSKGTFRFPGTKIHNNSNKPGYEERKNGMKKKECHSYSERGTRVGSRIKARGLRRINWSVQLNRCLWSPEQ